MTQTRLLTSPGMCLFISVLASNAWADSLNVKTGAWEMTHSTQLSGSTIPPDVLAKLPPERRAKIEASMKARAGKTTTHVTQQCLTQKELDEDRIIKEEDEGSFKCAHHVITKSSSKLVVERTCPEPRASTTHLSVEAKTSETIVASVDRTTASGKVHMDMQGKWIGASCDGIKERD